MKLTRPNAEIYIPDNTALSEALIRTTHLGIGAHQDDLEFMAFHGILKGYQKTDQWFGGVTCTNGAGSSRIGPYANFTDEDMVLERRKEQNTAADIGQYGSMIQLDFPSREVKNPSKPKCTQDLQQILEATLPEVVYTHNPADKHEAHLGVLNHTLAAIRALPENQRPKQVLGCEVWRGLDWMLDEDKIALDVSNHDELAENLNQVFQSQIAGGKRYDLATIGRRRANATFYEPHGTDEASLVWFAMDLTPLIYDKTLSLEAHVQTYIQRFADDVKAKLNKITSN